MKTATRTKNVAAIGLATLAVMAAGACTSSKSTDSGGGSGDDAIKIGLVTKTDSNPYFVTMRDAAKEAADEAGASIIAKAGTADGDNDSQVTAVENLISSGVDAILITPNDSSAIVPTLIKAQEKGIFVAALDTQTEGNAGVDATWATDNTRAGELQGQYIKAALGDTKPLVALLGLPPGISVGDQRKGGFLKGIGLDESSPEVVGEEDSNGDQGKGQSAMENLLQKNNKINVVYTINEPAAIGAHTAIASAGNADSTLLGSIDGGCAGVQAVKDGKIVATVMQFPGKMAQEGVKAAIAFAKDKSKPQVPESGYIDTGVELITDKPIDGLQSQDTAWGLENCWGGSGS